MGEKMDGIMLGRRLFVGGLYPEVTKDELHQRFSPFGHINSIEIKIRKDYDGTPIKTFAYIDLETNNVDLKKLMSRYNRTKWKGSELKIQQAKENFLLRLEKEREEQKELSKVENSPEESKKKMAATIVQSKLLDIAGIENMKPSGAKPGTLVPGKKDWIVGKYGRVLPIVQLKKSGTSKLMKVDPSKYTHTVRRIKETDDTPKATSNLTWQLEDKDSEVTKKRKGEFQDRKSEKKRCSNYTEIQSKLEEIISRNRMVGDEVEMEVVPVAAIGEKKELTVNNKLKNQQVTDKLSFAKFDSDSDSDGVTGECNNSVAARLDLSRFDSDSDDDNDDESKPSKVLSHTKMGENKNKDNKMDISATGQAKKISTHSDPSSSKNDVTSDLLVGKRKKDNNDLDALKDFKSKEATSRIKTGVKTDNVLLTNSVTPNNQPAPKLIEGKKKLKAFGGTRSLLSTVAPVETVVESPKIVNIDSVIDFDNENDLTVEKPIQGKVYISSDEDDVVEVDGAGASNKMSKRPKHNFSASKTFALQYSLMDEYASGMVEAYSKSEMNRMSDEDDDSDFESFVKKETLKIRAKGSYMKPDVMKVNPFHKESTHDKGIVLNNETHLGFNSRTMSTSGARTNSVSENITQLGAIQTNTNISKTESFSVETDVGNNVKKDDKILNDNNIVDVDSDDSESESSIESSDKIDENDTVKTLNDIIDDNEVVDCTSKDTSSWPEGKTDDENIPESEENNSVDDSDDSKSADDDGDDSESEIDDESDVEGEEDDNDNFDIENNSGESDDSSDFEKLVSEAVSVVKMSDETSVNTMKKNATDVLTNAQLGNSQTGNEPCLVKNVTNDCVVDMNEKDKVEMINKITSSDKLVPEDSGESEDGTDSESENIEKEDEKQNAVELEDSSESENSDSELSDTSKDEKQTKMECDEESDSEESDTDSDDCKIENKQTDSKANSKFIVSPILQVSVNNKHTNKRPKERQNDFLSSKNQTKKASFEGAKNSRTVFGQSECKDDIDRKRLEAVKLRQKENMAQKSLIQTALANLDTSKPANNKIVFDSDSDDDAVTMETTLNEPDQESTETLEKLGFETGTKRKSLFDSSDDDDDDDGDRFKIRQEFEGSGGEQLAKLQSRYGNDERFKLDSRFIESGSEEDEPEIEIEDETQRSLKILQSVVGVKAMRGVSKMEKAKKKFKDMGTLKYDPTKEEHQQQFEIKTVAKEQPEEIKTKKKKKKKDKPVEEEVPEIDMPEVSKEKFFEVSDSLKNTFIEKAQTESQSEAQTGTGFSLLSMFGNNQSEDVTQNEAQTGSGFSLLPKYGVHQSDDDTDNNDDAAAVPIPSTLRTNQMSLDNRFKVMDDTDNDDDDDRRVDNPSSTDKKRSAESETGSGVPIQPAGTVNKPSTFFFLPNDLRLKDTAQKPEPEIDRKTWIEKRRHLIDCYKSKYKNYKRKHRDGHQRGGNPRQRGGRRR